MKRINISILILLCTASTIPEKLWAQQAEFTQYYLNLPATNPAFVGIDDYLDVKAVYRQGWNDFEDKNSGYAFSVFGSLTKPLKQMTRSNALRISNPVLYDELQTRKELRRKHGLGGIINGKTLGPYKLAQMQIAYAYHLPVSRSLNWSFGTNIGYCLQKIDFSEYTVRDEVNDLFYQELIRSNEGRQSNLVIDFGSVLYSRQFYVGLSTRSLIMTSISDDNILEDNVLSFYHVQAGKDFTLSDRIMVNVAAAFSHSGTYDPSWSVTTRVRFNDTFYVGSAYEHNVRISLLFGVMAAGKYSVHYAYDKYLAGLSNFNVNSHEVVVGLVVFNKFNIRSKFW